MDNNVKDSSVIPEGLYCRDVNGVKCPYWSCEYKHDKFGLILRGGKCSYLNISDNGSNTSGLLWDKVKECGVNELFDHDDNVTPLNT